MSHGWLIDPSLAAGSGPSQGGQAGSGGAAVALQLGPNMLDNPSFEHDLDGWYIGTNHPGSPHPVVIDHSAVVDGTKSCKIPNVGTSHIYSVEQNGSVPVAGEYYFFEGYMKTDQISSNRGVVFMEFYNDQWEKVSEWVHLDLTADDTQPYTRMVGMFRAPTIGTLAKMGLKAASWGTEGTVWVDALSLRPVHNTITEQAYEAEDAALGGGATIDGSPPNGFSGGGAVHLSEAGAYVEWTVHSSHAQDKTIAVRWRERRELTFTLNGQSSTPKTWHWGTVMGPYATRSIHRMMVQGDNVIRITNSAGGLATIDKITILTPS